MNYIVLSQALSPLHKKFMFFIVMFSVRMFVLFPCLYRNEAGGLAITPCAQQHKEVWMGQEGAVKCNRPQREVAAPKYQH